MNATQHNFDFLMSAALLGMVAFCISMLGTRFHRSRAYMPLAAFFLSAAIVLSAPVVQWIAPSLRTQHLSLILPASLMLTPCLWLYIKGLTAELPWGFGAKDLPHFILPGLGMLAALLVITLPAGERETMLIRGELVDRSFPKILMLAVFVLVMSFIVQSGFYLFHSVKHLAAYRQRLRDLFASNEQRELRWLGWFVTILGGVWGIMVITLLLDNFFGILLLNQTVGLAIGLALIWFVGLWGLRQKPGFEGRYLNQNESGTNFSDTTSATTEKYKKSALGKEQASRIAKKLNEAMQRDRLFLDHDLSLHKLSEELLISPNYISQTLNETIGESFFDYVNRWRIEESKDRIRSGEGTILEIALDVGFNSRSSFYKAFQRITGMTPTAYRKSGAC